MSSSCAAKTLALKELVAEQADNGEFKPLMCIRRTTSATAVSGQSTADQTKIRAANEIARIDTPDIMLHQTSSLLCDEQCG